MKFTGSFIFGYLILITYISCRSLYRSNICILETSSAPWFCKSWRLFDTIVSHPFLSILCNWLRKSLCKLTNCYLHGRDKPPTKGVLVVNTNLMRVKRPLSFRLIWSPLASGGLDDSSSTDDKDEKDNLCSVWFPEAPKGYVALSCVVSSGSTPPPLASVFCILASSVSPCSLRDCIAISSTDMYAATNLSLLGVTHFLIYMDTMHAQTEIYRDACSLV